jgi:hypothetical protein
MSDNIQEAIEKLKAQTFDTYIETGAMGTWVGLVDGKVKMRALTVEECLECLDKLNNGEKLPKEITLEIPE